MILEAPEGGRHRFDGECLRRAFDVNGIRVLASIYAVDDTCVDVWLDADVELNDTLCAAAYDRVGSYLRGR